MQASLVNIRLWLGGKNRTAINRIKDCQHREPVRFGYNPDAKILVFLDNDGTLTQWKPGKYAQEHFPEPTTATSAVLSTPWACQNAEVALVTAKALEGVLPALRAANWLEGTRLGFFATNQGHRLFINRRDLPTEQWLSQPMVQLAANSEDVGLQEYLRKEFHWCNREVTDIQLAVAKNFGFVETQNPRFKPLDPNRKVLIRPDPARYPTQESLKDVNPETMPPEQVLLASYIPEGNSLYFEYGDNRTILESDNQPVNAQEECYNFIEALRQAILKEMQARSIKVQSRNLNYRGSSLIEFTPDKANGKVLIMEWLLNHLSQVEHIIAAGDSSQDQDYLSLNHLKTSGRRVPVKAIQVGDNADLSKALESLPTGLRVMVQTLAEGLKHFFEQLGANKQPSASNAS